VSDAVFAELRRHYDDRAIVEITAVACCFNLTNRFNTALDMDLTVYPKALG
jgi:alkylhydroperoxidase family enzyme